MDQTTLNELAACRAALAELKAAGHLSDSGAVVPDERTYPYWVGRLEAALTSLADAVDAELNAQAGK